MPLRLEDNERTTIAIKLADMQAIQGLLISNDRALINACSDRDTSNRLEDLLRDDQRNLIIIDTAVVQYGVIAEPSLNVVKMIRLAKETMVNSALSLYEKVAEHELINHGQAIAGLLIHKAAQIVGADIAIAIAPLDAVNFDNRTHQEQLKGIMEMLSLVEMTGQEADLSLWGMVQDAIAAVGGMAANMLSDHEIGICDLILLDQTKVNALFKQLQNSNDPEKLTVYFNQLHGDLLIHTAAVEEVLYPLARQYHDQMQKLYDDQAQMKLLLKPIKDQIQDLDPQQLDQFKTALESLITHIREHMYKKENKMFFRIQLTLSNEQEKRLVIEFETIKSRIQGNRSAGMMTY